MTNVNVNKQIKLDIDDEITNNEVYLVTSSGIKLVKRVYAANEALKAKLNLVKVNVLNNIPVVRIINYNKYLYDKTPKFKYKNTNKVSSLLDRKMIKLSVAIDKSDLLFKMNKIISFLKQKKEVVIDIRKRGRITSDSRTPSIYLTTLLTQLNNQLVDLNYTLYKVKNVSVTSFSASVIICAKMNK